METDCENRWKILSPMFFVVFTQMYSPALIRAVDCWNEKEN